MSSHPRRADHFKEWSKLMLEQAIVPERPQYKTHSANAQKGSLAGNRRKPRRRRRRSKRQGRKNNANA